MRCNDQVGEWKGALNAARSPKDPYGKGWELTEETLAIKWMEKLSRFRRNPSVCNVQQ